MDPKDPGASGRRPRRLTSRLASCLVARSLRPGVAVPRPRSPRRPSRWARLAKLAAVVPFLWAPAPATGDEPPGTYRNPLPIAIPGSATTAETFADPAVIRGD